MLRVTCVCACRAVRRGVLSWPQLESVGYAWRQHRHSLPSGATRAFFIGDGAGVGKGRQIAAIFRNTHFHRPNLKRHVWVSTVPPLHPAFELRPGWGRGECPCLRRAGSASN